MATPLKDTLKGKGKQAAGKAKETTSRWVGDEQTVAEGRQEQVAGKTTETKGKVKGKVKKLVDKL